MNRWWNFVILIAATLFVKESVAAALTITSTESLGDLNQFDAMALCKQLSNTTLDCSNLKLSVIPKNIPKTVLRLNLSGNHLENLEDDSFDECCEKLKVLDISNNQLTTLTQRHFGRLKSLETLLLGSNKITDLQPDTFEAVTSLRRLDLSRNEIKLNDMPSSGFLIQPTIKELNLDYCGIREFPDDTFAGVAQLRNLTLAGNPIDENMDVTAFQALEHLYKLRIPNLSKTAIYLICEKLVSIDVINFDEFNVSCTVLSDDEAFEEAVIANDKVGEPEIASVILPTTTTRIATLTSTTEAPSSLNTTESVVLDSNSISPYIIETSDDTNKTRIDTAETRVDIDNETIKFILLGIFVVTVCGIIIGLFCRADVCGIKTKMCRTNKSTTNRREPEDTVSPFEEIPLNNVNGKTAEGQG